MDAREERGNRSERRPCEVIAQSGRGVGQEGGDAGGDQVEAEQPVAQILTKIRRSPLLEGGPRLGFLEIAIEFGDGAPNGGERLVVRGGKIVMRVGRFGGQNGQQSASGRESEEAAGEVAKAVGEVGLVDGRQARGGEIGVGELRHGAEKEVAQAVGAVAFDESLRIDGVAERLADLAPFKRQEAVDDKLVGQGEPSGKQQSGPVNGVEFPDVLADDVDFMGVGVPPLAPAVVRSVAQAAEVVDESIYPNIDDLAVISGDGYAPASRAGGGSRDADVLEAGFDKG